MKNYKEKIAYRKLAIFEKTGESFFGVKKIYPNFLWHKKFNLVCPSRQTIAQNTYQPNSFKFLILKNIRMRQFVLFAALSLLFFIPVANAATLRFSPSVGSYKLGSKFSVSVYVDSAAQAMNAASGVVAFPKAQLEVISLSKSGSIFSLWVQEPLFSNADGTVNFEGIVLNPGFTGLNGKAITITFQTKASGTASATFSSGSVLANDGKGTNILTAMGDASFSIGGADSGAAEITAPMEIAGTPLAPSINSPTHPDPNKWYQLNNARFIWGTPSDITATRLLVGRISNAVPNVTYAPPIKERELASLEDGVWYFSVRLRNGVGWGDISRFRFQIDTVPPEQFSIKFIDGKETDNPAPVIAFNATDALSGIDYYRMKIGDSDFFTVAKEEVKENRYTLPLQSPGRKTILIQAYDKAGNYAIASEEFTIKPLTAPVFTDVPISLTSGEILKVGGKTKHIKGEVLVWFQRENETPESRLIKPDADGNFTAVFDKKVTDGIYKVWAEAVDERGAKSMPSEKITVLVEPPAFLRFGSWAINLLAVLISLIALIFALIFIVYRGWRRFSALRKKINKEVREAEAALHKAFDLLKEDIREQVKLLERAKSRRQLTAEEEKIIKQLKKDLDDAEKFVKKEIEDIEKEIK